MAYCLTTEGTDITKLNNRIKPIIKDHDNNGKSDPYLFPFKKRYLEAYGAIGNVRIYAIITFLLLLVACINYINLTTAQTTKRSRDVGIRKVVGAKKKEIMKQYFLESTIISILAMGLAFFILSFIYPYWRQFNHMTLELSDIMSDPQIMIGIMGLLLLISFLASSFPAFILSSFLPKHILQGDIRSGKSGKILRSILVVFQFSVSIALIIITINVYRQTGLMQNKKLGIDRDQVAYIHLKGNLLTTSESLKTEIQKIPAVRSVTQTSHNTTGIYWNGTGFKWEGKPDSLDPLVTYFRVDEDFEKTFGTRMAEGNFFSPGSAKDHVLINESFASLFKVKPVTGQYIRKEKRQYKILGVIKDFHFKPVNRPIGPIIIHHKEDFMPYNYIFMKLGTSALRQTLGRIKTSAKIFEGDYPLEIRFLDEDYQRMYTGEKRLRIIMQGFGIIAILISCLGLFGMASYLATQKTKEIGIRKVLGAPVRNIISMLLKEFTKWVLVANVIAWPVAYYYLSSWLKNYPFRISLGGEIFLIAGLGALVLSILTVSTQAYRAAVTNPSDCLRTE
jgi:ABC-type antimicrobial peptide transport system permease subunit